MKFHIENFAKMASADNAMGNGRGAIIAESAVSCTVYGIMKLQFGIVTGFMGSKCGHFASLLSEVAGRSFRHLDHVLVNHLLAMC